MKNSRKIFAAIAFLIAAASVILQFYLTLKNRTTSAPETITRFFSYFTILSNILVTLGFGAALSRGKSTDFLLRPSVQTATAVYITIVGLVYHTILRSLWNPSGLQYLADEALHTINPLAFLIYWFVFVKAGNLKWKTAFLFLIYPLCYMFFILIRGHFSSFYPYPFVNVSELGYEKVWINCGLLSIVFLIFSFLFIGLGRLTARIR